MRTKIVALGIVALVLLMLAAAVLDSNLAMYISIITIGLALALQKYVACFFGYFVITFTKMFQTGDRIRIGSFKGDVRDIRMFHFVLDEVGEDEKLGGELTGRILHMPNLIVLDQPVLNYSKGHAVSRGAVHCEYVFDEIKIPLKNNSNISKAAQLLQNIINQEDDNYIKDARSAFQFDYPTFLKEAETNRRVLIHIEPDRVWIKGKFVAPFRVRNDLRTRVYIKFIEQIGKDSDIHLA
ncbi:MAG: mechanosensitive ion channel family protein [Chloroflexi bacterium]|nr:mechanosensitive ion channel family protein [Chloroflexota bacterium]